ncbi:hypothetical protein [Streptomyces avermitilis]|uniref:hypothetical protein n=1 Tax=Streptomyces avermitilis TaxID=33903 RepID=UPI0036C1E0AB
MITPTIFRCTGFSRSNSACRTAVAWPGAVRRSTLDALAGEHRALAALVGGAVLDWPDVPHGVASRCGS